MTADGWKVLRFTGRDVHRDALACARQAYKLATASVPLARDGPQFRLRGF